MSEKRPRDDHDQTTDQRIDQLAKLMEAEFLGPQREPCANCDVIASLKDGYCVACEEFFP